MAGVLFGMILGVIYVSLEIAQKIENKKKGHN